ncbi:MAG: dipicolinate synthase [Clostridia bacterium]|nr:dipicolinate synthase [Clostridia bacterium]
MMKRNILAVLGGDERQISMAHTLASYGYEVLVWGLGKCEERLGEARVCKTWQEAVNQAEVILLPLPASADGVRVHCPLQETDVLLRMTALLDAASGRLLLGGRLSEAICSLAEQKQVQVMDYYDAEILQLKNALPTAEGAIAIAMRELPVTVDGVDAAVIGYGRIGSLLAEKLSALGAKVTVYALRPEVLTVAELHHHQAVKLETDGVLRNILHHRVIFNTVPHRLLTEEVLRTMPPNCVLIDLASAPGGIDHGAAAKLGLRCVWGTSLPGKCTPESAGVILAQSLREILESRSHSESAFEFTDGKDG